MSYLALYRKLRPQEFKDVVGQSQIVKTLMNQIMNERISHAYLFCGTRGTGKTSVAKIFAKVINCESPVDGEPCGKCKMCTEIKEQRSLNVIEIDAASNNGVDNIREIREDVKYPPTEGKFKVYIIDEVHMLSIGAFNALLKTLEEPPEHVIFILATTDPQKIPPTILSRVQRFDFKRIQRNEMVSYIKKYMEIEKINISDEALNYIAFLSDGAMRDAFSILDQCIAFYFDEEITLSKVEETIGSVSKELFYEIAEAFTKFDSTKCLEIIDSIVSGGRDVSQFVLELVNHFRNIIIAKSVTGEGNALDISTDSISKLREAGNKIDSNVLINYINIFTEVQSKLKYSSNPRLDFEIACIKICNPKSKESYEALFARIKKLEYLLESGNFNSMQSSEIDSKIKEPIVYKEKAVPEDIKKVINNYKKLVKEIDASKLVLEMMAIGKAGYLDGNTLFIVLKDSVAVSHVKKVEGKIKEKLAEKYEKDFEIDFITLAEYDNRHRRLYGLEDGLADDLDFSKEIGNKLNFGDIREI